MMTHPDAFSPYPPLHPSSERDELAMRYMEILLYNQADNQHIGQWLNPTTLVCKAYEYADAFLAQKNSRPRP